MAIVVTPLLKGRDYLLEGTAVGVAEEASFSVHRAGRITRIIAASPATNVDPIIGISTAPTGVAIVLTTVTAPALAIDEEYVPGVPYRAPGGTFYVRFRPAAAGQTMSLRLMIEPESF